MFPLSFTRWRKAYWAKEHAKRRKEVSAFLKCCYFSVFRVTKSPLIDWSSLYKAGGAPETGRTLWHIAKFCHGLLVNIGTQSLFELWVYTATEPSKDLLSEGQVYYAAERSKDLLSEGHFYSTALTWIRSLYYSLQGPSGQTPWFLCPCPRSCTPSLLNKRGCIQPRPMHAQLLYNTGAKKNVVSEDCMCTCWKCSGFAVASATDKILDWLNLI
jgi:hypothetical protein